MKKLLLFSTLLSLTQLTAQAQTPVWSTDIAPILYNNCASCHRPSGIGPFELLTYADAKSKAGSIASSVDTRYMPPWPPSPAFSRLAHERLLSQSDIDKIKNWAANGAPEGDPNLAPPVPSFSTDGDLTGTPDLVTQIPTFTSTATTGDVYQCFVIPSNQSAEKFITAFEAIPGNRDIVHHVLVYADTTGVCAQLDANHPGPGYVSFGGPGTDAAFMLGGWVPGTQPMQFPTNFGVRLPKNADVVIQIHYPAGSAGQVDSTKIKFYFSSSSNLRNVRIDPVMNHLGGAFCTMQPDANLFIPANQTKLYTQTSPVLSLLQTDVTLLGVAPHMHLIGRSINCFAVKGNDTTKLIDIPDWDFSWQGFYFFRKLIRLQQGNTVYSEAFFDNTTSNPYNPSNPPQMVTAGEATTDEMMITYLIWTPYQAGDENIDIDTSTLVSVGVKEIEGTVYGEQEFFAPYPNPTTNQLYVKYYLQKNTNVRISITDISGKEIKQLVNQNKEAGYHAQPYSVNDIPAGVYLLQMQTADNHFTHKVTIQ